MPLQDQLFGELANGLKSTFDLSRNRMRAPTTFEMETKYVHFGPNGKRTGVESYLLKLGFTPQDSAAKSADAYRCLELIMTLGEGPSFSVPELRNWNYTFDPNLTGADARGPMWGIPRERFADLTDAAGKKLPFNVRYAMYTCFIDFHSFNDVFARPMKFGKGIQDLRAIGQKIVHPASFIEAPVSFLAEVKPGSTFKNGQITLELKGLSLVDGAPCAVVAYDAGESSLRMVIPDPSGRDSVTEGGDQYKGDIYVDLATLWVRKATLEEYLLDEIRMQGSPSKTEYTTRHIILRLVG